MLVSHIISTIDKAAGGPSQSSTGLIRFMAGHFPGDVFSLHTLNSENPVVRNFEARNAAVYFHADRLGWSGDLVKTLREENPDLLHGHGLWAMTTHQMAKFAEKNNKPYIISPRGMLDTWSVNHKKWKKKIALGLYQRKDLERAAVIHATSDSEAENIRRAGFKNPIAVIANGIELQPVKRQPSSGSKTALFLSRLIKNKGIEELLIAWSKLDFKDDRWNLKIVGEGTEEYTSYLRDLAQKLNLQHVSFEGGKYGDEKQMVLSASDLFILPTYTENFGIAIAEALAAGLPVITTTGAPWKEIQSRQAGWYIDLSEENLIYAIRDAFSKSDSLEMMGRNGRKLIEEKYSLETTSRQMTELYQWILYKSKKPDFVI